MSTQETGVEFQLTVDGKKFVQVERIVAGKVVDRDRINPAMKRARQSAAKMLGVSDAQLLEWVDATQKEALEGNAKPQRFRPVVADVTLGEVIVRRLDQTDASATERYPLNGVDFLTHTLPSIGQDMLIKWDDRQAMCCLDIDYHDRPAPHESWLRSRVTSDLAPRPFAWNVTKRGGLHLFYLASEPFTGEELAAAAVLCWKRIDGTAGIELKTGVRGPGEKTVYPCPGGVQDTTALLAGWVDATPEDETARDEWLAAENMEMGKRYGHTKCPIWPTPGHDSVGEPVCVMETGIYCFNCEGLGRSLTRKPGFAPYTKLLGGSGSGDIGNMIRHQCHWGQARFVLTKKYGMIESLARLAYSAAIKAYHHGRPSAAKNHLVFAEQTEKLCRVENRWVNLADAEPWEGDIGAVLSKLPVACVLDEKDVPKADPANIVLLSQPHSLDDLGIPTINRIHGYRMTSQHLSNPATDPTIVEVYPDAIKGDAGRYLPQYVPKNRRNVDEAWAVLEVMFPKLDRKLVELIICGIASAQETQAGMQPMLFVAGSSGAAKTSTARIAANIMGGKTYDFQFSPDPTRWGQSVWYGARDSGVVMMNELVKDTERASRGRLVTAAEPYEPLLNITPGTRVHIPYEKMRAYGRLPMFILTEPQINPGIRDELQVARRLRYWKVFEAKYWDFGKYGLTGLLDGLRAVSVEVAQACNAIMSDIIDRRFVPMRDRPVQSWDNIADDLGAKTLAQCTEFSDLTPFMLEFFRLVCLAPDLPEGWARKRYPNGWKKIVRAADDTAGKPELAGTEDGLPGVYGMFADGRGGKWLDSKRLKEKDWQGLLKASCQVNLDLTHDGVNVYVRFRYGPADAPLLVNQQIVDPTDWEVRS